MSHRIRAYATAALLLGACRGASFDERTCLFRVHTTQVQGQTIRCGVLVVPEEHASPSKYIRVPVLIFKGKKTGTPIINLSGGPGQSWADLGLDTFSATDTADLPEDWIFIEQRGTGISDPRLDCPDQGDTESDLAFLDRCAAGLRSKKIKIEAYNTEELANDVADLQGLMGYKKVTVSGVSYGTAWGLQIMRAHGRGLAGAVLDSVVSPTSPTLANSSLAENDAFTAVFQACADNADCVATYGDVEAKMMAAIASLTQNPLPVTGSQGKLTAGAFFSVASTVLAVDPLALPRFVETVRLAIVAGAYQLDSRAGTAVASERQATASIALGQYLSVTCSDNQTATVVESLSQLDHVRPEFRGFLGDDAYFLSLCQRWPYKKRDRSAFAPVTVSVPTLVLAGALDPLTSPSWGREVATALPQGYFVEVPGVSHDVSASDDACVRAIVGGFYNQPAKPNTSCVEQIQVAFAPPPSTPPSREVAAALPSRESLRDRLRIWRMLNAHRFGRRAPSR